LSAEFGAFLLKKLGFNDIFYIYENKFSKVGRKDLEVLEEK
jgi:hypothetical protein